jgi:redox-sensitive bicupin YhaK (pirin superfamily)
MVHLISKKDQVAATIFGGNFITNKPVVQRGKATTIPYSTLFYWSHARAVGPVEFGLHPHKGFEIMTFVWEGTNIHYDTQSQKWTPLTAGQFQIITSGSGLQHAEQISPGTRSFQIWFDPNFENSLHQTPSYSDYNSADWSTISEDGFTVQYYVGGNSPAKANTEGLTIKTFTANDNRSHAIKLDATSTYLFYVLNGRATLNDVVVEEDDCVKVFDQPTLDLTLHANALLFVIQTLTKPTYQTVFN